MYSFIIIVLLILSLASCNTQQTKTSHKIVENKINVVPTATVEKINSDKKELNETFTDETEIGVPGKNKIEI
jgi:ABC-type phosphate/phosphonate transport system substrate-binding protein